MVVTAPVARWVDPDVGTEVLDGGTVAPVASVPPPPPGVDGPWVVYTRRRDLRRVWGAV